VNTAAASSINRTGSQGEGGPLQPLLDGAQFKARMPQAAQLAAGVADLCGREYATGCIRLAIALRQAVLADDYPLVSALYAEAKRNGLTPMYATEQGIELGVSDDEMRAFAARYRAQRRATGRPA
jgi:hypothetical protein